jgi:putative copper resistance protein D
VISTGAEVPLDLPRFTLGRALTDWGLDPWLFVVTVWVVGLYLLGVWTLTRRGDRWPWGRTFSFVVVGMGLFALATQSGIAAYDTTLLSDHMVQHMILSMGVPLAMALGAPVTLALRTLPGRPRRWLLVVLHSRLAKVLSFPPLTFGLFVLSPWALYFTGWYDASLRSAYVHEMMHVHLVLVGSLFFWPLMGVDPVPGRVGYPFRMLMVLMTLPFHAFLGVTIMDSTRLLAQDWYDGLRDGPMASWLPTVAADQHLAGGILWGAGDLVGIVFFSVLFSQWVRDSMREAAREDRRLDRLEEAAKRGR